MPTDVLLALMFCLGVIRLWQWFRVFI